MKFRGIKFYAVFLFGMLPAFSSCRAQNLGDVPAVAATGDTVTAIQGGIAHVFQAESGIFWFGSNGYGVYRYDPSASRVTGKYLIHFTARDGLADNLIRAIVGDKSGNVYFNTDGGVSKFNGKTFTPLVPKHSNLPAAGWRLHPDDLWFTGAQDSGVVYRYDGVTLHRLKFPKTKASEDFIAAFPRAKYPAMTFSPYDVYSIYKDQKGSLWFGTNIGVCRYDGKTFAWISEKELGSMRFPITFVQPSKRRKGHFGSATPCTVSRFRALLRQASPPTKRPPEL